MEHFISIRDIGKKEILNILDEAEKMEELLNSATPSNIMNGKILATLFYEPSTRTRLSFETAMKRLGGTVVGFTDIVNTSVMKGETLPDTIKVINGYADLIVMRHPSDGAPRLACEYSNIPIINAGDGSNQHPSQTMLDLYTIKREIGRIDNIKIAFIGDLKYGRTVHSLCHALSFFENIEIVFIAPKELKIPKEITDDLDNKNKIYNNNIKYSETDDIDLTGIDVVYMTRIQKERFPDLSEYQKVKGTYKLTREHVKDKDLIIMHPLPRVDEIDISVDELPQAKYFKQSFYGVPVRMAILKILNEKKKDKK